MEDIKEKTADERIARLIKKCDECKMNECIGCEICWGDVQEIAELIEEKERYKYLYQKALSNTIMSDRELFKYKDTTREIRRKIEFEYNYCLDDVTADLNKLLGDE